MLKVLDNLTCQLLHGRWAEVVSYSRHGAWKCTKPGCAAQASHDRAMLRARHPSPVALPTQHTAAPTRRAA